MNDTVVIKNPKKRYQITWEKNIYSNSIDETPRDEISKHALKELKALKAKKEMEFLAAKHFKEMSDGYNEMNVLQSVLESSRPKPNQSSTKRTSVVVNFINFMLNRSFFSSFLLAFIVLICCEKKIMNFIHGNPHSIENLQQKFPSQLNYTWQALEFGVRSAQTIHKPAVFLMVYDNTTERVVSELAKGMAQYASCTLNGNCDEKPIFLNGYNVLVKMGTKNYTMLLKKFKPEMEKKGVMVLFDLQELSGYQAQFLYSMCNEYTPMVGKSVYIFTVKVDHNSNSSAALDTDVLRSSWSDIGDDKYYSIFGRISNMVLRVLPEW